MIVLNDILGICYYLEIIVIFSDREYLEYQSRIVHDGRTSEICYYQRWYCLLSFRDYDSLNCILKLVLSAVPCTFITMGINPRIQPRFLVNYCIITLIVVTFGWSSILCNNFKSRPTNSDRYWGELVQLQLSLGSVFLCAKKIEKCRNRRKGLFKDCLGQLLEPRSKEVNRRSRKNRNRLSQALEKRQSEEYIISAESISVARLILGRIRSYVLIKVIEISANRENYTSISEYCILHLGVKISRWLKRKVSKVRVRSVSERCCRCTKVWNTLCVKQNTRKVKTAYMGSIYDTLSRSIRIIISVAGLCLRGRLEQGMKNRMKRGTKYEKAYKTTKGEDRSMCEIQEMKWKCSQRRESSNVFLNKYI